MIIGTVPVTPELPTLSSIKKALEVLKEKDLVYQTVDGYIVYDRFLDIWLKRML